MYFLRNTPIRLKAWAMTNAAEYVTKLENELTTKNAQNAYHALVKAKEFGVNLANIKPRYDNAVSRLNDRVPC